MPSVFLQESLLPEKIAALREEFPYYDFITTLEEKNVWNRVEILYGGRLSEEELKLATRLHWIQCPSADTTKLCLNEIGKRENILVSLSKGQNVQRVAEFVIGSILAFAKQFFHWPQVPRDPLEFWGWPLKETMWSMQKKILLQVGLGEVGTAIVKIANSLGNLSSILN